MLGLANPSIFINNNFTQKYYSRAFNELFSDNSKRSEMYFTPLRWYSYVSSTRAVHANYGLKTIINDPINIYFGYGIHNNQKIH